MLTSRGITLLASAGLAWLAGRTLGIAAFFAIAVTVASVVALGVVYVRVTSRSISVRRTIDAHRVVAGSSIPAALELRNDSALPSPTLLVEDTFPKTMVADHHPTAGLARFVLGGLAPGRVAQIRYDLQVTTRGRSHVGPLRLRVRDPFGVAERVRTYTAQHELLVYPIVEALPHTAVGGAYLGAGSSDIRRVMTAGDDFFTIREYVRGDDLRHVHWRSTAHRNTLMVRQMDQPWQAHATVYLDSRALAHTAGPEGTLEKAVSVAASLVYHLSERTYALRLITDDTAGRTSPDEPSAAMDHLAVLPASDNPGLGPSLAAARGGEGLFVGVLGLPPGTDDPAGHPDMQALFALRGFGQRMAIVVAEPDRSTRATRVAGLLRASGWKVAVVAPGQALGPPWRELHRPTGRRAVASG